MVSYYSYYCRAALLFHSSSLLRSARFFPTATAPSGTVAAFSHSPRHPRSQQFTLRRSSTTLSAIMNHPKRAKLDGSVVSSKVIGTHSGSFQADEAMGVWMLRQVPDYRNAKVVRSRDTAILQDLDIVIDVGGIYDHDQKRYDHHQRGYEEYFDEGDADGKGRCTKLSASGLGTKQDHRCIGIV